MNDTMRVIAERYSCRDYKDDMPSDEILRAITEAAVRSPSARNRQAWQVVLVKNEELLKEMEAEGMCQLEKLEDKTMFNNIMERGGKLFYGAPCMIVVAIDPDHGRYSLIDCGILCQNIALSATSLGLGNVICGLTGLAFTEPGKAKEFGGKLGFPKGYVFGCSVILGFVNTPRSPHEPDFGKITVIE